MRRSRASISRSSIRGLERLLGELRPNFVKIDARCLGGAEEPRRFVALAAAHGARAVLTRVEDRRTLARLAELPEAWVQGNAVGEPKSAEETHRPPGLAPRAAQRA